MFSLRLRKYARQVYGSARLSFGKLSESIHGQIEMLDEKRRTLMELAYGTLPLSDVGAVPFGVILSYADHAIFLRETYDHVKALPESLFLHYVFYPRVGTEPLEECRSFFFDETRDILRTAPEDRILAVNRWCAAHMTYQASDDRTESPLSAFYSGTGRCGEESVFLVTILRSLGIPARQIYAPWWSHCDDNHAWVEAWSEGKWHFLGACEIEPVLDRGWFIAAATRAPLIHSRTFFDYPDEAGDQEEFIGQDGPCRMYNQTCRYAETGKISVRVIDEMGVPCFGAKVSFQVINMASARTIARVVTDENGIATLTVGGGTICMQTGHNGKYGTLSLRAEQGKTTEGTLVCQHGAPLDAETELDFYAPASTTKNACPITPEQQKHRHRDITEADSKREKRIAAFYLREFCDYPQELRDVLRLAGAHGAELARFYQEKPAELKPLALSMLRSLARKDDKDVPVSVLNAHFYAAINLAGSVDDLFVPYVMCPRIGWEVLENWRDDIMETFTQTQRDSFLQDPPSLMAHIRENYIRPSDRYHRELSMTPRTALRLGYCDEAAGNMLFVAVMRTLGVPSRLSPRDGKAQYYRDGRFRFAEAVTAGDAVITLRQEPGVNWVYQSNFTLCLWENGSYTLLHMDDAEKNNPISVPPGKYRLITTNRLPNGNQLVRSTDFTLSPGENKTIALTLRAASPEEMLADNALPALILRDGAGIPVAQSGVRLLVWLDVGTEPTEHILNELCDAAGKLGAMKLPVILVPKNQADLSHGTLRKLLENVPQVTAAYGDIPEVPEAIARAMYLEPGQWPLVVLADGRGHGRYGHCGYGVGIVELALKLAGSIPE